MRAAVKLRALEIPPAALPARDFDLLATAVLLLDDGGRIVHVNPAAENLFELSRQKFVGHAFSDVFEPASALAVAIDRGNDAAITVRPVLGEDFDRTLGARIERRATEPRRNFALELLPARTAFGTRAANERKRVRSGVAFRLALRLGAASEAREKDERGRERPQPGALESRSKHRPRRDASVVDLVRSRAAV